MQLKPVETRELTFWYFINPVAVWFMLSSLTINTWPVEVYKYRQFG